MDNFLCSSLVSCWKSFTILVSNVTDSRYGSGYIHTSRFVCEYFLSILTTNTKFKKPFWDFANKISNTVPLFMSRNRNQKMEKDTIPDKVFSYNCQYYCIFLLMEVFCETSWKIFTIQIKHHELNWFCPLIEKFCCFVVGKTPFQATAVYWSPDDPIHYCQCFKNRPPDVVFEYSDQQKTEHNWL